MNAHAPIKPSRKISLSLSEKHSHGPLSYLEMGNPAGETVVFVHGFGADLLTWQLCLVPLAATYRLIALDLPGHGRGASDVGDASLVFMTGWLKEAFDVLDIASAHIVGHSMGAKIALGFVLSHAERVKSLSLIAPAGLGGNFHLDALDAFLGGDDAEALARQLLGPRGQNLGASLTASLQNAAADPARREGLKALLGNAKAYGLALSPEGFDWNRVMCPVQIMWGDHDRLIPMPQAHRLPTSAPLHLIEGAGHLPHMEASATVVAHLKEFLP
ncbi:Dihydrolipoyllysine-residue acetyltransferase component of acetoin cleaving system [Asticcacaulis sp. MM231]|uniref:alpha/beta fold hydrolase n=1 Tax=Asticcacaulis sp. MM231 TaxID=3157666 RepID=UPI0032D58B74